LYFGIYKDETTEFHLPRISCTEEDGEKPEEKGTRGRLVEKLVSDHDMSLAFDDDDFSPPSEDESDNEATLADEEAQGEQVDPNEELQMLEAENELPVEELFKLHYGGANEKDLKDLQGGEDN